MGLDPSCLIHAMLFRPFPVLWTFIHVPKYSMTLINLRFIAHHNVKAATHDDYVNTSGFSYS